MVKKLIKYDFRSYLRLMLPIQLIVIGFAVLNRFIQLFENTNSNVYNTIFTSSVVLYIISIIVALVLTVIVGIVRFYQGMYTGEGYLSHTLPVTPAQHIFSKLITAFIFNVGTVVAIFLSLFVATIGDFGIEVFRALGYIIGRLPRFISADTAFYAVELFILITIAQFTLYLKLYFCISVGQLARKKKILLAFGVYFGIYVIKQIIATIAIVFVTMGVTFIDNIATWMFENFSVAMHLVFCSGIVIELVLCFVYFMLSKYIMSKKLNLT